VRDYLVEQGVNPNFMTAKGYRESMPIAVNSNVLGRQQNRRVEMVVSGDVIGQLLTPPSR
jgi:outer membrane protein OmpA-like peptidoglycan-associated protein